MFAVGHEDGCISFACVSDENLIGMRTIERADVNRATEEDLFGWSAQGEPGQRQPANREPVFKLAWSGYPTETYYDKWAGSTPASPASVSSFASPSPSTSTFSSRTMPDERTHPNGGTTLTIMGGLLPSDPPGIHLWEFPPYVTPPGATTSATGNLPAPIRQALKDSIKPQQHNLYPTASPPEDFILLPRNSPHSGMAFDPTAILSRSTQLAISYAAH